MTKVACIIIAGGKGIDGQPRTTLLDERVIPSCISQAFDEVLVVGSHHEGTGYRYIDVPDVTRTTLDALIKRDVGTVATDADVLVYLADDHALIGHFGRSLRMLTDDYDILVPSRYVQHPEKGVLHIPNGEEGGYCAGHCGVFRRRVIQDRPWMAQPHHPNWDWYATQNQRAAGFKVEWTTALSIEDLEPERSPWL